MKQDAEWLPCEHDLDYIEAISPPIHRALLELETCAARDAVPIVDRSIGRLLQVLATGRSRVLEVGTAYGYSTLWLALGQPNDGKIITIDPDASRTNIARTYWQQAGLADSRITVINRPALDFIADSAHIIGKLDLAFLDGRKPEYARYVDAILPLLKPGAFLLADNALLSGRVSGARPPFVDTRSTNALIAFNKKMLSHRLFRTQILPVGDGLLLSIFLGNAKCAQTSFDENGTRSRYSSSDIVAGNGLTEPA